MITIPIILNVIDKTKQGAIINSAYGYIDAVDKFYINELSSDTEFELNGSYTIENGNLADYIIPFSGNIPTSGRLTYENNDFVNGIIQYEDYYVLIYGGTTKVINVPNNNSDGLYASNLKIDKGRYLYKGYNPNNYIYLKEKGINTLYRIISYETDGTIKVIRDDSIGSYYWDNREGDNTRINENNTYCTATYGCNVWGTQNDTYYERKTLNDLYGSFYYKWYSNNDMLELKQAEHIGTVNEPSSLNKYLNNEWLNSSKISDYISIHEFDVGGIYHKTTSLATEKQQQANYKWKGLVGLMYATDFIEATINEQCTSVFENYYYAFYTPDKNWMCGKDKGNWLHKSGGEWTMTAFSSLPGNVWTTYSNGSFDSGYTWYKQNARPSFYLKPNIKLSGKGTKTNPYIIENF